MTRYFSPVLGNFKPVFPKFFKVQDHNRNNYTQYSQRTITNFKLSYTAKKNRKFKANV